MSDETLDGYDYSGEANQEPTSFRAQIEALDVGETFSRAQRYDADETLKDVPTEAMRALRLGMQPTVFRIARRTGRKYTIETGEWRTQSRDIVACLAITRTY